MEFHDSRKERKTWTTPERPTVTSVPVDNGDSPLRTHTRARNTKYSPDHGVVTHLLQVENIPKSPRPYTTNSAPSRLSLPSLRYRKKWDREPQIQLHNMHDLPSARPDYVPKREDQPSVQINNAVRTSQQAPPRSRYLKARSKSEHNEVTRHSYDPSYFQGTITTTSAPFDKLNAFSTPDTFKAAYNENRELVIVPSPEKLHQQEIEAANVAVLKGGLISFPMPDHMLSSIPGPKRTVTKPTPQASTSPPRVRKQMGVIHQSEQAKQMLDVDNTEMQKNLLQRRNLQSRGIVFGDYSEFRRSTEEKAFHSPELSEIKQTRTAERLRWVNWHGGKKSKECLVCFSTFRTNEKLRMVPCGHLFHHECIQRWFEDCDECPTCKMKFV